MSSPVLVRSTMRTWDCTVFLVLGGSLLFAAAVVAILGLVLLGGVLGLAALSLVLSGALVRLRRVRLRRWVQDQGDGFLVIDRDGERRYADDQVLSMAFLLKPNYVNGLLKSFTRRFIVWLLTEEPKPQRLEMTTTLKPEVIDPLSGLIERVGDLLFRRAKAELGEGLPVLGECWQLSRDNLTVRRGGKEWPCPVAELAAVEGVDNDICLWRTGQEEAFARVPKDSANAYLLWRLLAEQCVERSSLPAQTADSGLGRVIFERRPTKGRVVGLGLVGAAALAGGAVLLASGGQEKILWGIACLAGGVAFLTGALHLRRTIFRCHQCGVFKSGLFGSSTLRYTEVAAITYSAVRHFHNGVYVGTQFSLTLEPVAERKGNRIHYGFQLKQVDQALESLRDQVSQMIAARMASELRKDGVVRWTKHLEFQKEGITYLPFRLLGRRDPMYIPFADVQSYKLHQGTFWLWVRGRLKPLVRESVMRPNFFPGFFLLSSIVPLQAPGDSPQIGS